MYICEDADEEFNCKEDDIQYNQCCQDYFKAKTCKHHCDYAHNSNCMVKKEINQTK